MPVKSGRDKNGSFYRWGESGKKYYYTPGNKQSVSAAKRKAQKQASAIYASGYNI